MSKHYKTKDTAISHLQAGENFSKRVFDLFRNDKEVVAEAVNEIGLALIHASDEMQADKDVVLKAVKKDGWALHYASDLLKADKDVVLEAVKQTGIALQWASKDIQDLCMGKHPVKALEKAIEIEKAHKKLQATLAQKASSPSNEIKKGFKL